MMNLRIMTAVWPSDPHIVVVCGNEGGPTSVEMFAILRFGCRNRVCCGPVGLSLCIWTPPCQCIQFFGFPQTVVFCIASPNFPPEEIVCMVVSNKEWFRRSTWCMARAFYFLSILCLYKTCRSQKTKRVILYIYILCKSL